MKTVAALLLASLIAAWRCEGQEPQPGDAVVFLNNYDANRPIFFFDGTTLQVAPFQTLVQVLGRPIGSNSEFQVLTNGSRVSTFFTGKGQDTGFFDGGFAAVPGVKETQPA